MITQEKLGIDERINEAFQPISNFWEGLILHEFFGTGIPTIIFLFLSLRNKLVTMPYYCWLSSHAGNKLITNADNKARKSYRNPD